MDAGNHQNFPAKQTQIAIVRIQTIGANSIKTPIDKCDIPEAEGTTSDGRKTSCGKRFADFGCRISSAPRRPSVWVPCRFFIRRRGGAGSGAGYTEAGPAELPA